MRHITSKDHPRIAAEVSGIVLGELLEGVKVNPRTLARKTNMNPGQVDKLLDGELSVSLAEFIDLMNALDLDLEKGFKRFYVLYKTKMSEVGF